MLELKPKGIIGIDLAGSVKNPTGWAFLENKTTKTSLLYKNGEILEEITKSEPILIAIDAPFSLPERGLLRKADREMIKKGYRVFPPKLPAMRKLTLRAIRLNNLIADKGYKTVEVHPTSTRKALHMPLKDWTAIQEILKSMGLKGELERRPLVTHEIDAITAALTAYLYLKNQTESVGNPQEGYIILPREIDWRTLTI